MLGWSVFMVGVLLVGAAVLATLAKRLLAEVAAVDESIAAVVALGSAGRDLADEITRTHARRTGIPGESLSPGFRR